MAKILHLGNIANNAYNNAKYLNIDGSHEHSAISYDNPHIMACPEWEEIDTTKVVSEFSPDWSAFDYVRPEWYRYFETSSLNSKGQRKPFARLLTEVTVQRRKLAYWLKDQGLKKTGSVITPPATWSGKLLTIIVLPLYIGFHITQKALLKLEQYTEKLPKDPTGYEMLALKLRSRLEGFDIIQAYGADIIIPYLLGKPYIAYEHGTLRDLPFDGSTRGNLLGKAYQKASYTIITNPDVIRSAKKLGLSNFKYIPHAVDCERFRPNEASKLRQTLGLDDKFVVVAPARQNWDVKGNQKFIKAFAALIHKHGDAKLFICDWGQHRDLTKQLVVKLGIQEYVTYYSPCPKLTSINYYLLADVVVDQFEAGAFGGITPEAMACQKPVLVYYDQEVHEWCFENHPPVINVHTETQITEALEILKTNNDKRISAGKKGREWVLQEYSTTQLVERHNKLYDIIQSTT